MATNNITFPIYNADGTPFNGLVLHNATFDSVVMSLGDKITGDVYYRDNTLAVTMSEYIEYRRNEDSEAVKFVLVNPPTVVREGIVSDNSELHGMTKYSFVFYHPMYAVSNFPFTDVAVSSDEQKYLSNSKTFNWIGNLFDMVAKLNKNLQGTQWVVDTNIEHYEQDGVTETSMWQKAAKIPDEPLSFDKTYVSEVLKTSHETWEIPFVIDQIAPTDARYAQGKRFLILFGTPSNEILDNQGQPYIFRFGQGVGLKNNSRTPKNNKIVTRIIGYGSENNIPFGYPQIPWYGDQSWDYTINNDSTSPNSYPIYKGIYGGKYVKLIKHPFTSKTLMPSVYYQTLFNKISPYLEREVLPIENTYQGFLESLDSAIQRASSEYEVNGFTALKTTMQSMSAAGVATTQTFGNMQTDGFAGSVTLAFRQNGDRVYSGGVTIRVNNGALTKTFSNIVEEVSFVPNPNYDPTIELIDYYDADNSYVNPAVEGAESVKIHQFEDIKPEFTEHSIVDAFAYDREHEEAISYATFIERMGEFIVNAINENEKVQLTLYRDSIDAGMTYSDEGEEGGSYTWHRNLNIVDEYYMRVRYTSDSANFNWLVVRKNMVVPATQWDDTMDDDGKYKQEYFKMTLPQLDFDLYACASITEEMQINMRSGACIGCTFEIAVDWDDYKANFYDSDGNFLPDGEQRDLAKYPKTNLGQVTLVVKKDLDTFGTLMPNTYQQPHSGDKFVILGISLPITYVTNAEARLDDAAKEYMRENNVHYYEYPLKFDEHFLATNTDILSQIRNNTIVRFKYGGELPMALYVKQITVKYSGVLPTYDITLTDDIEIVLNQIGQVTDDVSRMRVQVSELQKYYSENIIQAINEKLSKVVDDVCQGRITFQQGLDSIGSAIFHDELRSPDFTSGLYTGRGWRVDQLGNAEFESVRARSFIEVVELLVNRLQAQEGDTIFSDNDQIERVDKDTDETTGNISYVLSLKEKWQGYVTSQQEGNILCGIINTLAAKGAGVSDEENNNPQKQGSDDGGNKYYTSWMYVVATHNEENSLGLNQIRVVLYGDNEVPAGKNFEPCELMAIARRGCIDYADPQSEDYQQVLASIKRRQQLFYLSTSEGRIVKLTGVNKPKLEAGNYGTTLGIVPDFVKQWAIADRLIDGRDYLYAQGVIVGDFIKVDIQGNPVVTFVDKGEWQNNTEYLYSEYNQVTLQYETHEVWHNGSLWRVKQHQPVVSGGVSTYYEPTDNNSAYWQKLMSSGDSTRQIYSYSSSSPVVPQQYEQDDEYTPSGWSNTPLALSQQHKDVYISTRKKHNGTWGQWSTPVLFSHLAEDGTSIAIKGSAYSVITSSSELPSQPSSDTICLWNDTNVDDYEQYVLYDYQQLLYHWEGFGCDVGDGFIVDGDLWVKTTDTPTADNQRWVNVGRIKGDKGDDGKNTATVFIYKRFASKPTSTDKPTAALTYSFANGSLSGNLNGWSAIIPQSDGNPCWVRQVFVSSDSPTVTIAPTSWSTANKYTEDGKNGVSIKAQYSPDTIQIHTTWQTGDLYMRTRATNEASWSDWQRIVGENGANGDYTDYSFGISALLKTDLPTTAPRDISTWADAPVETTEQKPYLWSRVIKYVWVNGVKTVESTTYIRLTGEQGENGNDASEVNPNILLRTIFDKDIDFVKEQWSSNWSGTSIDTATDTIVEGRKSIRINAGMLSTNEFIDFRQNVYGKLKPSTWYTLSFNYFSTHNFSTFLWGGDNTPLVIDRSAGFYQDGTFIAEPPIDGNVHWEADWTGARHTLTFKTRDTFPSEYFLVMFRTYHIDGTTDRAQLALCMPKLEIGQVATAYMANEDDLRGEKGDEGARGKVGRFFYYGGEFNSSDNTPLLVNDAQVPYFEHTEGEQKRYHVFNPDETPDGGHMSMAEMWAASQQSWNNAPWEVMTNDFKYLITEAIFANFAMFGSAVISGDWMLSKHGLIYDKNGNAHAIDTTHTWTDTSASPVVTYNVDNAYTLFDVNNPYSSVQDVNNFVPCYSIDMLTGEGSYGCDKVHFGKDGSGWVANKNIFWDANGKSEFSGIIHASLLYSNTIDVDGGMYTIDPENSPANTFMVHSAIITLPSAEDYLGLELKFFEPHPTTRSIHVPTTLSPQSNEYIAKTYFDLVPLLEMVTQYEVPMGRFVTLKATNLWYNGVEYYCWMVVSGDDGGYSGTVQIGNKTMTYLNGMLMAVETV